MMPIQPPQKPSDVTTFAAYIYSNSATLLDFDQYWEIYSDLIRILYWNPDIDLPIMLSSSNMDFPRHQTSPLGNLAVPQGDERCPSDAPQVKPVGIKP
jgi:hypothetical protein